MGSTKEKKYGGRTGGLLKYIIVFAMIVVFVAFALWMYLGNK
jgi:hypothetical protein